MAAELLNLACNHCGAPLDVPEGTRFLTCGYCSSKLRIEHSGNAYYTSVLERIEKTTEAVADDLETIKLQNELERIDREWMMQRETFLVRGKDGETSEPDERSAAGSIAGVGVILFGIFWTIMAGAMFPPFALFGLLFIAAAVFGLISRSNKADQYRQAKSEYQARREEVLRRMEAGSS